MTTTNVLLCLAVAILIGAGFLGYGQWQAKHQSNCKVVCEEAVR